MAVYKLLSAQTTVTAAPPVAIQPTSNLAYLGPPAYQSFHITVSGTGTVSATVQIVGSNDGVNWVSMFSPQVLNGTSPQNSKLANGPEPMTYFGAYVTAISGTSAAVTVLMSC